MVKIDKKKFEKIDWKAFLKYPFVKYFLKNPKEEKLFLENLFEFIGGDKEFREKTGIESLDGYEAIELADYLKKLTTRRRLLKGILGVGAASIAGATIAKWPFKSKLSDKVLETKLLADFLTYTEKDSIDKRGIEPLLYDIVNKRTRGRAMHIGDGYFLTAYHVVKGVETSHKLVLQRKSYADYAKDFKILYYDSDADIALLKASIGDSEGKALVHLIPRILRVGENVSSFTRFSGIPDSQSYEYEIYGKDYYDQKIDMKLGKFNLPAGSLLFETQGLVLVKNDFLILKGLDSAIIDKYSKSLKYSQFTSLMMYNSDSGSPVFLRLDADKYMLAGIVTSALGIQHKIITPNHPLSYKGMQQTGVFFTHREVIEKLIMNYLETKKRSEPS